MRLEAERDCGLPMSNDSDFLHQQAKYLINDKYALGKEIGRGASGHVYIGYNVKNGDTVAIKKIGLQGVSEDKLQAIMQELDIIQKLKHKHIVTYRGAYKTKKYLFLVMDYMEHGAIDQLIRPDKFGVFPEFLVAIYIAQVLHGLAYLHEQGFVHRDIKGANTLMTKDGIVKLADFGVATSIQAEYQNEADIVAGTPYWMAPEVIEMTCISPASDIWSVGCLTVEMLTGRPPYFDKTPMAALFRIVSDKHPPLPSDLTQQATEFLLLCFDKNVSKRPTAKQLMQHPWIVTNRQQLKATWSQVQSSHVGDGGGVATHSRASYAQVQRTVDQVLQDNSNVQSGSGQAVPGGSGQLANVVAESSTRGVRGEEGQDGDEAGRCRVYDAVRPEVHEQGACSGGWNKQSQAALRDNSQDGESSSVALPHHQQHSVNIGSTAQAIDHKNNSDNTRISQAGQQRQDVSSKVQQQQYSGQLGTEGQSGSSTVGGGGVQATSGMCENSGQGKHSVGSETSDKVKFVYSSDHKYDVASSKDKYGVGKDKQGVEKDQQGAKYGDLISQHVAVQQGGSIDEQVVSLTVQLSTAMDMESTCQITQQLDAMLRQYPHTVPTFIDEQGAIALIEILQSGASVAPEFVDVGLTLLLTLLQTPDEHAGLQGHPIAQHAQQHGPVQPVARAVCQSLSTMGVIPVLLQLVEHGHSGSTRTQALLAIQTMLTLHESTPQMLIACAGLPVLCSCVVYEADAVTQVDIALSILRLVMNAACHPLNHVCRLLAHAGFTWRLSRLLYQIIKQQVSQQHGTTGATQRGVAQTSGGSSIVHHSTIQETDRTDVGQKGESSDELVTQRLIEHASDLLLVLVHADMVVKLKFAQLETVNTLFKTIRLCNNHLQRKLLRCIKMLSNEASVQRVLQQCDSFTKLISLLKENDVQQHRPMSDILDLQITILQIVLNMCKCSVQRKDAAAEAGIVTNLCRLLTKYLEVDGQQFACDDVKKRDKAVKVAGQVLVATAQASQIGRQKLGECNGMKVLLKLLEMQAWQSHVMKVIARWLKHAPESVHTELAQRHACYTIINVFKPYTISQPTNNVLLINLLDCLLPMLSQSSKVSCALSSLGLPAVLGEIFQHADALTAVRLLKIIHELFKSHFPQHEFVQDYPQVVQAVQFLAQGRNAGAAVQVRDLAQNVAQSFVRT